MSLPKGQQKVMQSIAKLHKVLGRMPTLAELSDNLGYAHQSVRQHLGALQHKGYLELRSRGQGRVAELHPTLQGKALLGLGIPLLGSIRAGPLSSPNQEVKGLLRMPSRPGCYALVIEGDSQRPRFEPGDLVVLRAEPWSHDGQIAAVRLQEETTLKRVYLTGSELRLESINPEYRPFSLPADEVEVQGVYDSHLGGRLAKELLEVFM